MTHDVIDQMELVEQIRSNIKLRIDAQRMELWFGTNTRWTYHEQHGLTVTVSNEFLADCIRSFCATEISAALREVVGSAAFRITCDVNLSESNPGILLKGGSEPEVSANTESPVRNIVPIRRESGRDFELSPTGVDAKREPAVYGGTTDVQAPLPRTANRHIGPAMKTDHWSEFIESQSNRMGWTAAQMVVERPGTVTPLLIHGPCGSGKSHLIRGISEQLRCKNGMRRVLLMTAEQFTIDYTESARGAGFASFRKKYRDVEALIIDDVQFLLGKQATLLELRNTSDNLLRNHRQVVFAADRSLAELAGLGNELHTRLTGGMTCSLDPLDFECRRALLQRLCGRHQITISKDAIESLARAASGDARILHGMTFRLLAAQRSHGDVLTESIAFQACSDLLRASQPVVRMVDIEKAVCDVFGLSPKCLQEKSKSKVVSQPRMLAMFLARKYTRAAYTEIGEYFGNRQHSTVISAQKKVEGWLTKNQQLDHSRGSLSVREMLRNLESVLQVG